MPTHLTLTPLAATSLTLVPATPPPALYPSATTYPSNTTYPVGETLTLTPLL